MRPGGMFRWGVYVSLGVLAVLAAAAAVYTTRAVLVRVLIALFIAVSLDPAVRALTRRGMRRSTAVLVIFLIPCGRAAAFLVSVIPALVHLFQSLVHDFPGYIASLWFLINLAFRPRYRTFVVLPGQCRFHRRFELRPAETSCSAYGRQN